MKCNLIVFKKRRECLFVAPANRKFFTVDFDKTRPYRFYFLKWKQYICGEFEEMVLAEVRPVNC